MLNFLRAVLLVLQMGPDKVLRLQEESVTDPLTGLLNRRGLRERLLVEKARSDRYRRSFLLVYMDLDGLKEINDTLGHHEGDKALVSLAEKIQKNIRATDFASRIGGDEFVIVFTETAEKKGVLNRLLADVSGLASIGHYRYCGHEPVSLDEIVHLAESEMRENKKRRKAGRD